MGVAALAGALVGCAALDIRGLGGVSAPPHAQAEPAPAAAGSEPPPVPTGSMTIMTATQERAEAVMSQRCGDAGYEVEETDTVPMGQENIGRGKTAMPGSYRTDTRQRFHCVAR